MTSPIKIARLGDLLAVAERRRRRVFTFGWCGGTIKTPTQTRRSAIVKNSTRRVAAQVAVEAVANDPDAYEEATRVAVLRAGESEGVAAIYLDLIRDTLTP